MWIHISIYIYRYVTRRERYQRGEKGSESRKQKNDGTDNSNTQINQKKQQQLLLLLLLCKINRKQGTTSKTNIKQGRSQHLQYSQCRSSGENNWQYFLCLMSWTPKRYVLYQVLILYVSTTKRTTKSQTKLFITATGHRQRETNASAADSNTRTYPHTK